MHATVFTPDNPSPTAIARVTNPLPAPTECPFCSSAVRVASHEAVYGRDYSDWPWMYHCTHCDASVGMHPFTHIPLGTMADRQLREVRKKAKAPFERIWRGGRMTRAQAYRALAEHLNLSARECHFGWFNAEQCQKAKAWAEGIGLPNMPAK